MSLPILLISLVGNAGYARPSVYVVGQRAEGWARNESTHQGPHSLSMYTQVYYIILKVLIAEINLISRNTNSSMDPFYDDEVEVRVYV